MVEGIRQFLVKETACVPWAARRTVAPWTSLSRQTYETSVSRNRERLRKVIGVMDSRIPCDAAPKLVSCWGRTADVGRQTGTAYRVYAVKMGRCYQASTLKGCLLEPSQVSGGTRSRPFGLLTCAARSVNSVLGAGAFLRKLSICPSPRGKMGVWCCPHADRSEGQPWSG